MAIRFDEDPIITDKVYIEFQTTDEDGEPFNPYKVQTVTIYFLQRGVASSSSFYEFTDGDDTFTFANAVPVKVYGSSSSPAWYDLDQDNAVIQKVDEDEDGDELFGVFSVDWDPSSNQEGDYFVCWTWQPLVASTPMSSYLRFYLSADTKKTTSLPTQVTIPGKYDILMDRYLPEMYKNVLSDTDLSPDVINRLNSSVAVAFTDLENKANQILGLIDANAIPEAILPYLANLFSWKLKSEDSSLWRRQVKEAVSLYKKKGTQGGLEDALASAGIVLNSLTQYWQITSSSTYQESFRVEEDGQTTFVLTRTPLSVDALNFSLGIIPVDETSETELTSDDVSFNTVDGVSYMEWEGDFSLQEGDIIRVLYKIATVSNQSNENYIRSLPLADNRSEVDIRDAGFCYPRKNYNVRLIADDDSMMDILCPTRNPFYPDIVFGQVRTEFPYSENVYNMDEYSGSLRDSTLPCDIDRSFHDSCSYCLSSNISLDISLDSLSNDRISEAREIVREFVPFHAVVHDISYSGTLDEFILPPVENITSYIHYNNTDYVVAGQMAFNRTIHPWTENFKRNALAMADNLVTDSGGFGFNIAATFYYPADTFDTAIFGLDVSNNLLEILSGTNSGDYSVENPNKHLVDFSSPGSLTDMFDSSAVPFRLSNILYTGSGDIYQDDKFLFSDPNNDLSLYNLQFSKDSATPAKIVINSGLYAGSYTIYDITPSGSFVILGWGTTTTVSSLNYSVKDFSDNTYLTSTTGKVEVQRRGRFVTTDDLVDEFLIEIGHYLSYSGSQYKIIGFKDNEECYIEGYTGGTVVGIGSLDILKRLLNNGVGYVGIRGLRLETTTNYYDSLGVSDELEDDQHMENFLILIDTDYYQIESWSNVANGSGRYEIVLRGSPLQEWGTSGTSGVNFSIIQFLKTRPVEVVTTFPELVTTTLEQVDRRGLEVIVTTTETEDAMPLAFRADLLNAANHRQPMELMNQTENISIEIIRK